MFISLRTKKKSLTIMGFENVGFILKGVIG